jgi:2-polyprenyl-3-methyl-5-hydroxy-6-metoxy-1,4-benzoquinol methylase
MSSKKKLVEAHFDDTPKYLCNNAIIPLRKFILKPFLEKIKGKQIVDFGCGNGEISIEYIKDNHVTFVDISLNMLKEVGKNISPEYINNVEIVNLSIEEFEVETKYDVVICIGVLAHVEDISLTINKLSNSLKDQGKLYLQLTDWSKILTWCLYIKNIFRKRQIYKVNKTTLRNIISHINKSNLEIKHKIKYFPVLPLMSLLSFNCRYKLLKWMYQSPFSYFASEVLLEISKKCS